MDIVQGKGEWHMRKKENLDLRAQYSRSVLKRGLVALLLDKPLDQISISELCKACGINRGTFYHHYSDIRDVYNEIEKEFFSQIERRLDMADMTHVDCEFFSSLLRYFFDNPNLAQVVYSETSSSKLMIRVRSMVRNRVYESLLVRHPEYTFADLDDLFGYIIGGVISSIIRLLSTSQKNPDIRKGGKMLAAFTNTLIDRYLPRPLAA